MISRHRPSSTAAFLFLLAACAGSSVESVAQGVARDSAGVTIVEHAIGALAEAPLYTLGAPTTLIGGINGGLDATAFIAAWLLDDGFIALNQGDARFTRFGFDGKERGGFGRRGFGPDDFRMLQAAAAGGDSVLLIEQSRSTSQVLRPDLTTSTPVPFGTEMRFDVIPFGRLSDGSLVAIHMPSSSTPDRTGPPRRAPISLLRIRPGTMIWDTVMTIGDALSMPFVFREGAQESVSLRALTMGAFPIHGVWNGSILYIDNDSRTVASYDREGKPIRLIRLADPLRPVDAALRDSVVSAELRGLAEIDLPADMKASMADARRNQPFADSMAPWDRAVPARDGGLWIRAYAIPLEASTWWYNFSAEGRLLRRLEVPAESLILSADGDRVLIRRVDKDDIGYLEVRTLTRPAN